MTDAASNPPPLPSERGSWGDAPPWRLPAGLEPFRHLVHVEGARTIEQAVNDVPASLPVEDPRRIDRQRVLAQVNLLKRQVAAHCIFAHPDPSPPLPSERGPGGEALQRSTP